MKNKVYDAIIGLAVGDAFGVPYEFTPRESVKVNRDPIGYGTHNQPPGTWSDDTSMILATMDALTEKELDPYVVGDNFVNWLIYGKYTPHGRVFDVGCRTLIALQHYRQTGHPLEEAEITDNGNGSLMRILPLAFLDCDDDLINEISALTHPHEISKACCRIYVKFAKAIIDGCDNLEEKLIELNRDENEILNIDAIFDSSIKGIKSSGYVVDSLEAALWSFLHTKKYEDAIVAAVSLGYDTDTIAAITGGIAGLYYGVESIPENWKKLANIDLIHKIIDKFVKNMSNNSTLCN